MDEELSNSLEAIANLLYLIRKSLGNRAAADLYIGLAEDRMKAIALRTGLDSSRESILFNVTSPASRSYRTRTTTQS
jgi:hypothetical protein